MEAASSLTDEELINAKVVFQLQELCGADLYEVGSFVYSLKDERLQKHQQKNAVFVL